MMRGKKIVFLILLTAFFGLAVFAQDDGIDWEAEQKKAWETFSKKNWEKLDFSKTVLTKAQLAKLKKTEYVSEAELLRGVVFGKRGRVFAEKAIQNFLLTQKWYKPNPNFKNSVLTVNERKNIDLIREVEANLHDFVEPGDLRWWKNKAIPTDKIQAKTAAEWQILIAEIEAIHGKTFPEQEWLQKYFDERYWYKRNPNYDSKILNATERKNLQAFIDAKNADRKVELSPGDMDKFQNAELKEEMLKGLNFNELRLIRNEFFARRGLKFKTAAFSQYFSWQDWYRPAKDQTKVKLNAIEEKNVKLIESFEAKMREELATRLLNEDDITGLYLEDLRIMRNEVYARRGYVFSKPELQKYFGSQPWYQPNPEFKAESFTEVEVKNIALLKEAEDGALSKFVFFEG